MAKAKKQKKNNKHPLLMAVLGVLLMLIVIAAAAYVGIGYFFSTHFYPQTTVNGVNAALANEETVQKALRSDVEGYILAVHDREDRVTYFDHGDMDYTYMPDDSVSGLLLAQDSYRWPLYIRGNYDYTIDTPAVYDDAKLLHAIEAMDCFKPENIIEPKDAYIDDEYNIIPEVLGSSPLKEQIVAHVMSAIDARESVLKLSEDDYKQPAITTEDDSIKEKVAIIEKYRNMTITYEIDGYDQVLDGNTITSWITINEDMTVTVDPDKTAAYAQLLASTYNTFADKRSFTTTQGDTITIGGGDYGWIVAKAKEAEQLIADIENGESISREPKWEQRAFVTGTKDIGNTYIEIDYTNQHMYYYKDGSLILDSDIVSGNLNNGNGSPDGVFKVIDRKSPAVLSGEDYQSEVTYFMPFAYNVGFHDASWRSNFGGNIYKGNGSHGCINMPYEKAKTLYSNVDYGTPVIAYYRESVKLSSNNARVSNAYSYRSK